MSSQKTKKRKTAEERAIEAESARVLGKHISKQKAQILMAVTMIACALPMVLGIRLWNEIPEIVSTGLIGVDGRDDSLPRWAVVFLVPGLMCLLNLICHGQLYVNQKRMTVPSRQVRLLGRWGFPVISVLLCSGLIMESAGRPALSLGMVAPCALGLLLLMLGSHMWDCPRDAVIALRFSFTEHSTTAWKAVHRFAGWLWITAGLLVIAGTMLTSEAAPMLLVLVFLALIAPLIYGRSMEGHLN